MHDTASTIRAVELEGLLCKIDAENVDFHDELPHVWVSASVSPEGRRRVHTCTKRTITPRGKGHSPWIRRHGK